MKRRILSACLVASLLGQSLVQARSAGNFPAISQPKPVCTSPMGHPRDAFPLDFEQTCQFASVESTDDDAPPRPSLVGRAGQMAAEKGGYIVGASIGVGLALLLFGPLALPAVILGGAAGFLGGAVGERLMEPKPVPKSKSISPR